ncbi:hypothetical protein GCM10010211_34110 [Streptomyces albospinus]|uniref:Uncharacterized protein n=1 Tax=Streptomyces albospinus TaxID=285515 RepID=A0ABQ2V2N7_9ACTN|nr:hypothetical protein GCM10010211_34110 [Streptomyces albospinus]
MRATGAPLKSQADKRTSSVAPPCPGRAPRGRTDCRPRRDRPVQPMPWTTVPFRTIVSLRGTGLPRDGNSDAGAARTLLGCAHRERQAPYRLTSGSEMHGV